MTDATVVEGRFRQVGILVEGVEFIPLDIARAHMPFAQPPGMTIQAVYVEEGGDDG